MPTCKMPNISSGKQNCKKKIISLGTYFILTGYKRGSRGAARAVKSLRWSTE